MPYLLCLTALFLAYQFNRCRLMLATLGLGRILLVAAVATAGQFVTAEAARLYLATSLAVPLLCLYLLLVPETGIWHLQGCIVALVFLFLALASSQLAAYVAPDQRGGSGLLPRQAVRGYILSHGATLLMALVLVAGLVLVFLRDDETDSAVGRAGDTLPDAGAASPGGYFHSDECCRRALPGLGTAAQHARHGLPR